MDARKTLAGQMAALRAQLDPEMLDRVQRQLELAKAKKQLQQHLADASGDGRQRVVNTVRLFMSRKGIPFSGL
jgi:hypothetical protein